MDDCILFSLSLPPGTKSAMSPASCSPAVKDSDCQEGAGHQDASFNTGSQERARQRQRDARDPGSWQLHARGASQERRAVGARPCDETIDLTTSNENADSDSGGDNSSSSLRGARVLRKRKLSHGGGDVPAKQPAETSAFL